MTYAKSHYLVTVGGALPGNEIWQTGMRWCPGDNPSDATLVGNLASIGVEDIYDDAAAIISGASYQWPAETSIAWAKVAAVDTAGEYLTDAILYQDPSPTVGVHSGVTFPNQIALAVTTWSGQRLGKGNYGRMYWPAPFAVLDSGGRISSAYATVYAGLFADLVDAWSGEVGTVSVPGYAAIMSQAVGTPTKKIEAIRVGRVLDTQRRRRNNVAEDFEIAYTSA